MKDNLPSVDRISRDNIAGSNKTFGSFQPVSIFDIEKVIFRMPSKSCSLDPLPTKLVKMCIKELTPVIYEILNHSLMQGHVPDALKVACITPVLKKPCADTQIMKNFRPVSNLCFVSKLLENIVSSQLDKHLNSSGYVEKFQSAYKKGHFSILKVQSDISSALDRRTVVVMVQLDMSAAFDTVNHNILLERMESEFGLGGKVISWFASYLKNRIQHVVVNGARSISVGLNHGVPQGSVLGPKLFSMYTYPLGSIISRHGLKYHIYDTQIYFAIEIGVDLNVMISRMVSRSSSNR